MSTFSDEQLSAFLDGELEAQEHARLAEALVDDPQLSARLDRLSGADNGFTTALSSIDDRPLPAGLEALLEEADKAQDVPVAGHLEAIPPAANDNSPWRAIAASIALVAAFTAGGVLSPFGSSDEGTGPKQLAALTGEAQVHDLLENSPSGTRIALSGGETAEARLSFVGTSGEYCREFAIGDAAGSTVAVACRDETTNWDVKLAAAGPAMVENGDRYTAASDNSAAFDAAVSSLMASESADAETENAWIEGGWEAQ